MGENIHETVQYFNLLFDFYGEMLTPKQNAYFIMHYMEDNSLSEIGEQYGITPQAAADILKRTIGLLTRYEAKLGLVRKFEQQQLALAQITQICHMGNDDERLFEVKRLVEMFPL